MELAYKPDFDQTNARWEALYAGEIIDRPITNIVVPKNPEKPVRFPQYMSFLKEGIEASLAQLDAYLENTWFMGDAIPAYRPDAGPDMFAAFMGTPLRFDFSGYPERWPDAWAVPMVDDWDRFFPLTLQEDNDLWQKTQHALKRTAERAAGRFIIASPDLHSNIDALVAMRGSTRLIYDLADGPKAVYRAMSDVREAFFSISDRFFELACADEMGSIRGPYCQGRCNIIAADCAALLSPELFRKLVLPAIEEEAEYLDHSMFHVDGPDMVKFLDDILAVKRIDAINYVPGVQTGPKRFAEWTDFFRRVQNAGKIMEIYNVTADEVKALTRELRPEKLYFSVTGVQTRQEAEELLGWLKQNT